MGRRKLKPVILQEFEDEVLHVSGLKVKTQEIFNNIKDGIYNGTYNLNINFEEQTEQTEQNEENKQNIDAISTWLFSNSWCRICGF